MLNIIPLKTPQNRPQQVHKTWNRFKQKTINSMTNTQNPSMFWSLPHACLPPSTIQDSHQNLQRSKFPNLGLNLLRIPKSKAAMNSRIKSWEFQFANITFLGFHKSNILYIRNDIKIYAGPTEAKNFKSQLEKNKKNFNKIKKTTHQTGKKKVTKIKWVKFKAWRRRTMRALHCTFSRPKKWPIKKATSLYKGLHKAPKSGRIMSPLQKHALTG